MDQTGNVSKSPEEMTAREYAIAQNAETVARAKAEGWVFWTTYPEDEAYWVEQAETYGIRTGADVHRRDLIAAYSDLYKERHGIRPRWIPFPKMTTPEIEALYDELAAVPDGITDDDMDLAAEAIEEIFATHDHPMAPCGSFETGLRKVLDDI